jgi:DsbC/DsbD-like thiol-disulfide interchange protein
MQIKTYTITTAHQQKRNRSTKEEMVRACREAPQHSSTYKSTRTERTMKEIATKLQVYNHASSTPTYYLLRNTKKFAQSKRHTSKAENKSA